MKITPRRRRLQGPRAVFFGIQACLCSLVAAVVVTAPFAVAQKMDETLSENPCEGGIKVLGARVYEVLLACQIQKQRREVEKLEQAVAVADSLLESYDAVVIELAASLEAFVADDLPFDVVRVRSSTKQLRSNDVAIDHKLELLLAMLSAQRARSGSIESTEDTVTIDGKPVRVSLLRVGGVGLFYARGKFSRGGYWDKETKAWVDVSWKTRRQIDAGIRMAEREQAPNLLMLPVPAPKVFRAVEFAPPDATPISFASFIYPEADAQDDVPVTGSLDPELRDMNAASLETGFEDIEKRVESLQQTFRERYGLLVAMQAMLTANMQQYIDKSSASLTHMHLHAQIEWVEELSTAMRAAPMAMMASADQLRQFGHAQINGLQAAGEVVQFRSRVRQVNGKLVEIPVVRVGAFNVVTDGYYLSYDAASRTPRVLKKQPAAGGYLRSTSELMNSSDDVVIFGVDVTRNRLLEALERL